MKSTDRNRKAWVSPLKHSPALPKPGRYREQTANGQVIRRAQESSKRRGVGTR